MHNKLHLMTTTYGSHMGMRYQIEREMMASISRNPGLRSSNLGLEILENRLSKLDPEDFMRSKLIIDLKWTDHS